MTIKLSIAILTLLVCLSSSLVAQQRTTLTITKCNKAPVIDGKINPDEWKDTAGITNFIDAFSVSSSNPNTVVYVTADDTNLYIAAKCIEPDPKGPRGFIRKHDDRAFEDDCIQVYIAPEDMQQVKQAAVMFGGYEGSYNNWYTNIQKYYEFTVNCKGSITESMNDVRDWNTLWTSKVGREKGAWTVEIAVPFSSIGIHSFPDNALWGLSIFRTRQAKQSGWVSPSYGGYTPLPVGSIRITKKHPIARQTLISTPKPGTNNLEFELVNYTDKSTDIEIAASQRGSVTEPQTITLEPGSRRITKQPYTLNGEGGLFADYTVRVKGEEIPLLTGTVNTNVPARQDFTLRYFAVPAQVYGDIHLNPGSEVTRAVMSVQVASNEARKSEVSLTGKKGINIKLPADGKPGDTVKSRLELFAADGRLVASKDLDSLIPPKYSWLDNKIGLPLKVLPPYTPIVVKSKSVSMLGKSLQYSNFALPTTVTTAGMQILSGPMKLSVKSKGKDILWLSKSWKMLESDDQHVKIQSIWQSRILDLNVISNVEYDGFIWSEATITPHGIQSIDSVALEIPLKKKVSKYVYRGNAQQCNALSPVGMRGPITDNTWLGDERRGIGWYTESLEWVKANDYGNQVEIVPGKTSTMWRSTFIDTPTKLTSPYTMKFALHITPAKPVSLHKENILTWTDRELPANLCGHAILFRAKGLFNQPAGTFECWVKPTFNTNDISDTSSKRLLFQVNCPWGSSWSSFGNYKGVAKIYYSAASKSFTAEISDVTGQNTVTLNGTGTLPNADWSFIRLSWGDKLRLNVNGKVSELDVKGSFEGDINQYDMLLMLNDFEIDELRMSNNQRLDDSVPAAGFTSDANTVLLYKGEDLEHPEKMAVPGTAPEVWAIQLAPGKFGNALTQDTKALRLDALQKFGKTMVSFFQDWSPYQGYPYLGNVTWLRSVADAVHGRGMRFILYFNQDVSDACPVWKGMEWDYCLGGPPAVNYTRDDVVQNAYTACGNGPFRDMMLDGIAKLADQADIDGVYMDGTTVPWWCENPTHPGCGEYLGDGTYQMHRPIRGVREFMKRLRNIFVQRGKKVFMDAHTGGVMHLPTQSFTDQYNDGEQLHRYKPGFKIPPDTFITGYMGQQFGMRSIMIQGPRASWNEAVAIALVHDTMVWNGPDCIYKAMADYNSDDTTRYIPYWDKSKLYSVSPSGILGSVYLNKDKALLVFGSQTEKDTVCSVNIAGLLGKLPKGIQAYDAISNEKLEITSSKIHFDILARNWRMIELR
jgi:hypothetical protein